MCHFSFRHAEETISGLSYGKGICERANKKNKLTISEWLVRVLLIVDEKSDPRLSGKILSLTGAFLFSEKEACV